MFTEADSVIVAHTKSGQTWLRAMLSHLFHLRYGVPIDELIHFDNFHRRDERIPRIYFARDARVASRSGQRVLAWPNESQNLLFLVRDPRDIAVSFYFHVKHRASDRELYLKSIAKAARESSPFDFVSQERYGIAGIVELFNRWLEESVEFPHVHYTRYEDMRVDPSGEFKGVLRFLGVPATDDEVMKAVAFGAFENMKQLELAGFFKSGRMGATVPGVANSLKVRTGEVGGYAKLMTDPQRNWMDGLVQDRLDHRFGYGARPLLIGPARLRRDGTEDKT
jgi:hypothetical protein